MANKILRLDITKIPDLTPIIYGRVQDGLVQTVDVYVTNNGEPFDLTGWVIKFEGNTSGNRTYVQDLDNVVMVDRTKGYFTYTFPLMAFAVAGKYEHAYFSFTKGEQRETTSDFNIQVFENADITAEEAHSVIREYDELVEELNRIFLEAQTNLQDDYDEFKAEYDAKYNAYITDLTNKIKAAQNKIDILNSNYDKANAKLTDLESRMNDLVNKGLLKMEDVLSFLAGKDIQIKFSTDFAGKISGSLTENPNVMKFGSVLKTVLNNASVVNSGTELLSDNDPSTIWKDYSQIMAIDGKVAQAQQKTEGYISFHKADIDVITMIEKIIPNFFVNVNATTKAEKKARILEKATSAKGTAYGFGTTGDEPNYSIGRSNWTTSGNTWQGWTGFELEANCNKTDKIVPVSANFGGVNTAMNNDGIISFLMGTYLPSDGTKLVKVHLDYFKFEIAMKLNITDLIPKPDLSKYYTKIETDAQFQKVQTLKNDGSAWRISDVTPKPTSFHDLRTTKKTFFIALAEAQVFTDYVNVPSEMKATDTTGFILENIPDVDNVSSIQILSTTSAKPIVARRRVTNAAKGDFSISAQSKDVVDLTKDQNVGGLKNFTGTLQYNGTEVAKKGDSYTKTETYTKTESDGKYIPKSQENTIVKTIGNQNVVGTKNFSDPRKNDAMMYALTDEAMRPADFNFAGDFTKVMTPRSMRIMQRRLPWLKTFGWFGTGEGSANDIDEGFKQYIQTNSTTDADITNYQFIRTGTRVQFFGRIKFTKVTGTEVPTFCQVPEGYRLSNAAKFTFWNVPLTCVQFNAPDRINYKGFVERIGTNNIKIGTSTYTGNTYWYGEWFTSDAYPTSFTDEVTERMMAHRGATVSYPENTLEAFKAAIDLGYGGVELDPRLTSDGKLYLMHDDTVDRTTDGTGNFSDLTEAQVKALNIKIDPAKYPNLVGQTLKVPSLDSVLLALRDTDLTINFDGSKIDLSVASTAKMIHDMIVKYRLEKRVFFVISDKTQRDAFHKIYPQYPVSWLWTGAGSRAAGTVNEIYAYGKHGGALLSIPMAVLNDDTSMRDIQASGIYYQVYGVQTKEDYETCRLMRVPMIETDQLYPNLDF